MNWTSKHFGLMVAYVLPGFIVLAGIAPFSLTVASWLQPLHQTEANVGAPLYAVLLATTIGMILSCFRWLIIDHIHFWTGLERPVWDDSHLGARMGAFEYLVQAHFSYYQFYGHTVLAAAFAYSINRVADTVPFFGLASDIGLLALCAALFIASRDALARYYARTIRLIGQIPQKGRFAMTNGNHTHESGSPVSSPRPRPEVKRPIKPQSPSAPKESAAKSTQR